MSVDTRLAADLAAEAGRHLLALRAELGFDDPDRLRREGDRQAHELICAGLAAARPDDVVLSEEAADPVARLAADRVWIVDPLDGTREYAEPGRTDWAVHVALWERGPGLTAGAVALPAEGAVLASDNPVSRPATESPVPRVVLSRTRPSAVALAVAEALGAVVVPMGSAGAKAAAVIRGEAEAYVHSGGQAQWDSAAPVAVALAAGLHVSRLDGSPLDYNEAALEVPGLVVCVPELAEKILRAIGTGMR